MNAEGAGTWEPCCGTIGVGGAKIRNIGRPSSKGEAGNGSCGVERDGGCERRTAVNSSQLKRIGQLGIYISYDSHIVVAERIRLESDPKSRAQLRIERGWR